MSHRDRLVYSVHRLYLSDLSTWSLAFLGMRTSSANTGAELAQLLALLYQIGVFLIGNSFVTPYRSSQVPGSQLFSVSRFLWTNFNTFSVSHSPSGKSSAHRGSNMLFDLRKH